MQVTVNVENIGLADIRDMPEWVTDSGKVDSFRRLIREGKSLPTLRVRDAGGFYEVIDGFHRYRALVAEDISTYPCTVERSDERTAELDRIQASLTQPDDVFIRRATEALRQMFVRDMRSLASDKKLLRVKYEAGRMVPCKRHGKFPDDPFMAILVIENHMMAKAIQQGLDDSQIDVSSPVGIESLVHRNLSWAMAPGQQWEYGFLAWIQDVSQRLGGSHHVESLLGLGIGVGSYPIRDKSDLYKAADWFRALIRIADEDMQRLVIRRIRDEDTDDVLRLARVLSQCRFDSAHLVELLSLNTLRQVTRIIKDEHYSKVLAPPVRPAPSVKVQEPPKVNATARADEAVFTVVSPSFAAQPSTHQHTDVSLRNVRRALTSLIDACERYENAGGTWDNRDAQEILEVLRLWVDSHKGA